MDFPSARTRARTQAIESLQRCATGLRAAGYERSDWDEIEMLISVLAWQNQIKRRLDCRKRVILR